MTPMIIQTQHTRIVNCIFQEGIRYCENQPITREDMKGASIAILALIVWTLLILYLWMERELPWIALAIFLAPFILLAIFV